MKKGEGLKEKRPVGSLFFFTQKKRHSFKLIEYIDAIQVR